MAGRLYVVPNLLGIVPPEGVLPQRTLDVARALERWVVETPKAARAYSPTHYNFAITVDGPFRQALVAMASSPVEETLSH